MSPARKPASGKSFNGLYDKDFIEDLRFWVRESPKVAEKIHQLVANTLTTPFTGLGKPEPLRHERRGYWSRRITQEHRLVYQVEKRTVYFIQCRYHY